MPALRNFSAIGGEDSNFIISNLGGIGGAYFTPVTLHPQVVIPRAKKITTAPDRIRWTCMNAAAQSLTIIG